MRKREINGKAIKASLFAADHFIIYTSVLPNIVKNATNAILFLLDIIPLSFLTTSATNLPRTIYLVLL